MLSTIKVKLLLFFLESGAILVIILAAPVSSVWLVHINYIRSTRFKVEVISLIFKTERLVLIPVHFIFITEFYLLYTVINGLIYLWKSLLMADNPDITVSTYAVMDVFQPTQLSAVVSSFQKANEDTRPAWDVVDILPENLLVGRKSRSVLLVRASFTIPINKRPVIAVCHP